MAASGPASVFGELESVFNSTAYCPNDIINQESDISTIQAINTGAGNFDFYNDIVMTAANYKSNATEVVGGSDLLAKQTEIDSLYLQYLMITTMNENLKKNFCDEEKTMIKDSLELHKANECLKKQCFELEYEESIIDNLLEIVDFMDKINEWIQINLNELQTFQANYQSLAEICSKAKNYLKIANIHKPENIDFEETVAAELKKTYHIVQQINNIFNVASLQSPPATTCVEKIDFELIAELRAQNNKLKDCILRYNGLKLFK